jgi:predicted N-acetyltransferase YhbS
LKARIKIDTLQTSRISLDDQVTTDLVDHLAFADQVNEDNSIQWSPSDWMVIGRLDGEIVAQLCLLKREIRVGVVPVKVVGVGGVATLPKWRHHGFGTELMRAASTFMRSELYVPFGLLICASETQPFYAHLGWKAVATELWFEKNKIDQLMKTVVMTLPLGNDEWPLGEINLCGLPW